MNAWLLTWEGTRGPAMSPDNQIVAILSGRLSTKSVEPIVDVLYTRCALTADELTYLAHKRKDRQRQFKNPGTSPDRFIYGHNPWIYARRVTDLVVERDENQGLEHVSWTDPPEWAVREPGTMPVQIRSAIPKQLTRTLQPIVAEIY